MSWVRNNHSMKMGYSYRRYYIHPFEDWRPIFSFDSRYWETPMSDFSWDIPTDTESWGQGSVYNIRHNSNYFYFQDDWKVSQRLTLNLGLRYELRLPWRDKRGTSTNLDPVTGILVPALLPPDQQPSKDKSV